MSALSKIVALAFLSTASALAACASESTSSSEAAIEHGPFDTGDPAVGYVTWPHDFCSAFLAAPDVVVTAAHCAIATVPGTRYQFFLGNGRRVTTGSDGGGLSHDVGGYAVKAVVADPDYPGEMAANKCGRHDLAIVRLAAPIVGVTPLRVDRTHTANVGQISKMVGFGGTGDDTSSPSWGQKRSGNAKVTSSSGGVISVDPVAGAIVAGGDSGSPLLFGGAVQGVASCNESDAVTGQPVAGVYTALNAANLAWIDRTLHAMGTSL